MDNSKHWMFSKTILFGAAQLVFGLIGMVTGWIDSQTAMTLLMTGLATVGLRFGTTQPISGFDK
jgi:hypothetical protein